MERPLSELQQIQRRITFLALSCALLLALPLMALGGTAMAKGLVLGTCFSIINFILMGKSLPRTLMRSRAGAGLIGFLSVLARYAILAVPLILGIKSPAFHFVAVVIGIFSVQIVTLGDYLLIRPLLNRR